MKTQKQHDLTVAVKEQLSSMPKFEADGGIVEYPYESGTAGDSWNQGTYRSIVKDFEGCTCGTTGCVAGWAIMIGGNEKEKRELEGTDSKTEKTASELLGIEDIEVSNKLFSVSTKMPEINAILDTHIALPIEGVYDND